MLDFTGGLAGTEEVITRLKRLAIENICLENISNLVHCIVHLLVLDGYESVRIISNIYEFILGGKQVNLSIFVFYSEAF